MAYRRTCAGGGGPEDAEVVAASSIRRERPSLEGVEARDGPRRTWCSNSSLWPLLTTNLGANKFL